VFEKRVLKKIFGPKWEELRGGWRNLRNKELHLFYSSPNSVPMDKSEWIKLTGHANLMGEKRNLYVVLVWKPEGKRPLGNPRHIWGDNTKTDPTEMGWDDVEWIHLAKEREGC
jgi:hypothetical protein